MTEGDRRYWKEKGNIFVMTEVWEDRQSLLDKYGWITRGSLTIKVKPHFQVSVRVQVSVKFLLMILEFILRFFISIFESEETFC